MQGEALWGCMLYVGFGQEFMGIFGGKNYVDFRGIIFRVDIFRSGYNDENQARGTGLKRRRKRMGRIQRNGKIITEANMDGKLCSQVCKVQ
ncbi:MAG: hypothetical protein MUO26_01720 [Methanotrichaceae archaeon]|nr:hypothetical protein [Methanotrichaceae archaeon]